MLSMNSSVSEPSSSRKYSATVRAGERHPQTRSGRLGHLAVDQRGLGFLRLLDVDHARLLHFEPEVVALTGALAHAGEHGEAAVLQRHVVDELHDDDGLADAGAAEQADLAALQEGLDQVDDLDAGLEHLHRGGLLVEGRRLAMDGQALGCVHRSQLVHGLADDVEHATEGALAYGNGNRAAEIDGLHAANHAVGGLHGDAAHAAFAELLLDFEDDVDGIRDVEAVADHAQRRIDRRQIVLGELHVHRGTCDLNDVSDIFSHMSPVVGCLLSVVGSRCSRPDFQRADQSVQDTAKMLSFHQQSALFRTGMYRNFDAITI